MSSMFYNLFSLKASFYSHSLAHEMLLCTASSTIIQYIYHVYVWDLDHIEAGLWLSLAPCNKRHEVSHTCKTVKPLLFL
jgi:hypothetical protein